MDYRVLGPLEVVDGGASLELGRRKQRAVLAALLVQANRVVSLDRLIDELWGEEAPAQATASLQAYISNLRRVLEPERAPRQPATVLVTRPPGYMLRVDPEHLDSARFAALAAEGHRLLSDGKPGPARQRLDEALALWRGPALADFAYESFAQVEAGRLEELRLAALEDRLQAGIDLGSHAAAVAELEPLLAGHPLRERLWGLQMVALYRSGRQADALRAFQTARRIMGEELGIEPGAPLRRLEADILAQAPSLELQPSPADGRSTGRLPRPDPPPDNAPHDLPLVGREPECGRIAEVLDGAQGGRGAALLLLGEAGIGKTRLAQELDRQARAQGFRTAWGRAYETATTPAFWPWVEVIRSLLGSAEVAGAAAGGWTADLAQIVPEVRQGSVESSVDAPPEADADAARFRLFEAVAGFLGSLAATRPLLVVLDDLQWMDVASLELLSFLAPKLRDSCLVIAGTYRPTEIARGHPLGDTLAALARVQVAERIALEGLSEDEVDRLVASTTGARAARGVVATVHARTGGNPFFVTELTRLLHVEHSLGPEAVARSIPAAVRDVVRLRLARLPEQTTALMSLAAVAGREFDLRVIEAAAELDAERVFELVEVALVSGLVVADHDAVWRCRFSHDLVREAILADLSGLRRARLHARLADALGTFSPGDEQHAVELAYHSFESGAFGRPEAAVEHGLRAARLATARLAYEQAADLLHRCLNAALRLPAGPERDRSELEVLLPLSSLVAMTRGFGAPEAHDLLTRALTLCEQLGETREVVPVMWRLGSFHNVSGGQDAAYHLGSELLRIARQSGRPAEQVAAHHGLGVTALEQGRPSTARRHLEEALALQDGLDDPWLVAWLPLRPVVICSTFLAWALALLGDQAGARALTARAVEDSGRLAHDFTTVHALAFDAWMAGWAGDFVHMSRQARDGMKLAEARAFPLYSALCRVFSGWAELELGDPEVGRAEIGEGVAGMEGTGSWMLHPLFLALQAEAHRRTGRPGAALASIEEGLTLAGRSGSRFYDAELHRLRGEVVLGSSPSEVARAEGEFLEAISIAREQGSVMLEERAVESLRRLRA